MTTPFTICGSVFLLLANLPVPGYADFMASIFGTDWTAPLNAVAGGTFSVLALIVVLSITYKFVENEGCDAMMAAILALSTFLILMPPTILTKGGETVSDIIPKAWAGSNGVITAIFVSFFRNRVKFQHKARRCHNVLISVLFIRPVITGKIHLYQLEALFDLSLPHSLHRPPVIRLPAEILCIKRCT